MTTQTTKPSAPKKADTQTRNRKLVLVFCALLAFTASCLPAFLPAVFLAGCHKDDGPCVTCPPPGPDTTSHNFTWTIDTLGDGNSSSLYDVAIINDTLAYAVGEIYLKDSTGQIDPQPYSVARWNGKKWFLQKLFYNTNSIVSPIRGIWVASTNDIWLAAGSVFHWTGSGQEAPLVFSRLLLPDPNATIEKLWGSSSSNLYGVGNAGTIVFYNGGTWQKLESGTNTLINDAWGVVKSGSTQVEVYCAVTDFFEPKDRKILKVNGIVVDSLEWHPQKDVYSVWTSDGATLYVGGDGLWTNGQGSWQQINLGVSSAVTRIRGNANNDIFVVGAFGLLAHFNATSWKIFSGVTDATLSGLCVKGNRMAAVGSQNGKPVVLMGMRN